MATNSNLTIKFLQVLHGDSIHIRFLGSDKIFHNIFIDGGFSGTYQETLKKEVDELISRKEKIDLFIVTHTDRDHIGGVNKFVSDYGETDLVKEYWFNSNLELPLNPSSTNKISINDGINLRDYLIGKSQFKTDLNSEMEEFDLYGSKLKMVAPLKEDLEKFKRFWDKKEAQERKKKQPISSQKKDHNLSIETLSENVFLEDTKLENKVSIAFLLQVHEKNLLFLGDNHPSTIVNYLKQQGYSSTNKLKLDLVKISHHASRHNTSNELVSLLDCNSFAISANGKNQFNFPHKEALSRFIANSRNECSEKLNFYFNYDNKVLRNLFSKQEKKDYNFLCQYPDVNENGIKIQF